MPVAVAPVHQAVRGPLRASSSRNAAKQSEILLVDRTLAAEVVIVLGNLQRPLAAARCGPGSTFSKKGITSSG